MNFENRGHKINYLLSENKRHRQEINYRIRLIMENDVEIGRLYWEEQKEREKDE